MKALFLTALSLLLFACSADEPASPITVNTSGNEFHNAFFGISVTKPEGWYDQSPEETLMQQHGTQPAADEASRKAMIEAALNSNMPIFGFFAVQPGTPGRLNPNVLGVAENLSGFPDVQTGCDYLAHVQTLLSRGQMAYRFEGGCESRQLAGAKLDVIEGRVALGTMTVTQRYYATVRSGYAIAFVQTYFGDEGQARTAAVIDSIRFD